MTPAAKGSRKTIASKTGRFPTLTKTPGENSTASSSAIIAIANRTTALIIESLVGLRVSNRPVQATTSHALATSPSSVIQIEVRVLR